MKPKRIYKFRGELYAVSELIPYVTKYRGKMVTMSQLHRELKRSLLPKSDKKYLTVMQVLKGKATENAETKCICGCGRKFADQNGRKYWDIKTCKHRHYKRMIDYGCVQPSEWRLCKCGEWFPVFAFISGHTTKKYCDEKCKKKFHGEKLKGILRPRVVISDRSKHCFRKTASFESTRCAHYNDCGFKTCRGYQPENRDMVMRGIVQSGSGVQVTFGRII